MAVKTELFDRLAIQVDATAIGADPHVALGVAVEAVDRVVVKAVDVYFVLFIDLEALFVQIEDVQAAVVGAHPKVAISIAREGQEHVVRKAVWVVWVVAEVFEDRPCVCGGCVGRLSQQVEASALRGDPEEVILVFIDPGDIVSGEGVGVRGVVAEGMEDAPMGGFANIEAAVDGAEPDAVLIIFDDGLDVVVAKAGGVAGIVGIVMYCAGLWIEYVYAPAVRSDPDIPLVVLHDVVDEFCKGVGRIVYEPVFQAIVPADAAAPGGDPEVAILVFGDRGDEIVANAFAVAGGVLVDGEFVAVVSIEAIAGAKPHKAAAVL